MNRRPAPLDRVSGPRPSPELRATVLAAARARRLAATDDAPRATASTWLAAAWLLLAAALLAGHLTLDVLELQDARAALAPPATVGRPDVER